MFGAVVSCFPFVFLFKGDEPSFRSGRFRRLVPNATSLKRKGSRAWPYSGLRKSFFSAETERVARRRTTPDATDVPCCRRGHAWGRMGREGSESLRFSTWIRMETRPSSVVWVRENDCDGVPSLANPTHKLVLGCFLLPSTRFPGFAPFSSIPSRSTRLPCVVPRQPSMSPRPKCAGTSITRVAPGRPSCHNQTS